MMMNEPIRRRDFLAQSAAATGAMAIAGLDPLVNPARARSANETLTVGLIGCGGMGRANLSFFIRVPEVRVAALADPDKRHLEEAEKLVAERRKEKNQEVEKYTTHQDFRELLDRKDIDCVIIATPDHWHALTLIYACQAGKDVYCEKPISHNIVEGRMMVNAVKRYKRVCQVGTQQRSGAHFQRAIELIRQGAIGEVYMTRTWNYSNEHPDGIGNPPDSDPPSYVDYDLWLGPAPKRPFNRNRFHYTWRWFFDYAGGMVCDWNVHLQDIVHLAMGTFHPVSVVATGGKLALRDNRDTPDTLEAVYEFRKPDGKLFVQIYTVRKYCLDRSTWSPDHGIQFFGSDGVMKLNRGGFEIVPEIRREGNKEIQRTDPVTSGGSDQNFPHVLNFLECVKSRATPRSDIETMHYTTVACHLANISYRVGRKIYWDPVKERCFKDAALTIEDSEANAYLAREYRRPWELPKIEA
jgi:predicted dehydrogenase